MKTKLYYLLLSCLLLTMACSEEENLEPSITLEQPETAFTLGAEQNDKLSISFHSTFAWQATANVDWVVVSPLSGAAGDASISILSKEENRSGDSREGSVTISSNDISKDILFMQVSKDIVNLKQTAYEVPAEGQTLAIEFETNLTGYLPVLETDADWIVATDAAQSRVLQGNSLTITVLANKVMEERSADIRLNLAEEGNPENTLLTSEAITIRQDAAPVGVSKDFTADKEVFVLQAHTRGNGIPVVLLGDGFLDTDIADGYYRTVMEQAMENFFTEEPFASLREYFDVWMVNAVSLNNSFANGYSTAFNCWLEGNGSTLIEGDNERVMEYVQAVPELAENPSLFEETMSIVVLNTMDYAGTCHYRFSNASGQVVNFSVCYCPTINSINDDMFRRVLCHEAGGHGFAKLMDEYSYQEMGAIPQNAIAEYRQMQEWGWAANVDFTSAYNDVLWSRFLNDARYQGTDAYGERLGVYDGACTYWSGAYRPTSDSMMRNNQHGFNAPSREAIYKRVMGLAYGDAWTYDYEEFVTFDQAHLPHPAESAQTKAAEGGSRPFATPVFADKPLKYIR